LVVVVVVVVVVLITPRMGILGDMNTPRVVVVVVVGSAAGGKYWKGVPPSKLQL
jgi:hypothetical protein